MEEDDVDDDGVGITDDTPIILSFFCSISSRSSFVEDDGQSTTVVFFTVVDVEIIVRDDDDDDDDDDDEDDDDDDKLTMCRSVMLEVSPSILSIGKSAYVLRSTVLQRMIQTLKLPVCQFYACGGQSKL